MAELASITVQGSATLEVAPDVATVELTVECQADTAGDALGELSPRSTACDAMLESAGDVVRRRITRVLSAQPVTHYDPQTGEQVRRGYLATRTLRLELIPGPGAEALLRDLVALDGASLAGPWWSVDPDNTAHDLARTVAASDARRRAEAYAAGLGIGVGGPQWVSELAAPTGPTPYPAAEMRFARVAGSTDEEPVSFATATVSVVASVTVCFAAVAV